MVSVGQRADEYLGRALGKSWGLQKLPTCLCYVINSHLNQTQKVQKISQLIPQIYGTNDSTYVVLMCEKRMAASEIPAIRADGNPDPYITDAWVNLRPTRSDSPAGISSAAISFSWMAMSHTLLISK